MTADTNQNVTLWQRSTKHVVRHSCSGIWLYSHFGFVSIICLWGSPTHINTKELNVISFVNTVVVIFERSTEHSAESFHWHYFLGRKCTEAQICPLHELIAYKHICINERIKKYVCVSQFYQILNDQGLSEDVKLKRVKWPDGKFFQKKKKEEWEQSCVNDSHDQGTKRKKNN